MDGVAAVITAVCAGLAALLVAAIPLVQLKYRKPLQQANEAISGVATATGKVSASFAKYNGLVAQAKANDGKVDAGEMANIMTQMGSDMADIAAYVGTEITAVKNAGK
jgi:uncharacterized membrane protein YebE (DUF533 family)